MFEPLQASLRTKLKHIDDKVLVLALRGLIYGYQSTVGVFFRGACRFEPSCSHYASTAIDSHGTGKGTWLAFRRLVRCQPFCAGGFDPVP